MNTLFDLKEDIKSLNEGKSIPVFNIDKKMFENLEPIKLLEGFNELKSITFSSSLKQVIEIATNNDFKFIELIIGLSEDYKEISFLNDIQSGITDILLKDIDIRIYQATKTHTKLYLLQNEDKKRVITGSANFSQVAWKGRQDEIFLYSDDEEIYYQFESFYERVKDKAKILLDEEIVEKERKKTRSKINIQVENVEIGLADEKFIKILQDSNTYLNNISIANFVLNGIEKPKLEERKLELEKEVRNINNLLLLKEHEKEVLLEKEKAIPKILSPKIENDEDILSKEEIFPFRLYYKKDGFYINSFSKVIKPHKERIKFQAENLSSIFSSIEEENKDITKYIMETIMFSFAGAYIWYLRKENPEILENIPVFAFLGGIASAGKSLTLRLSSRLTRGVMKQYNEIKNKKDLIYSYFYAKDFWGVNPLMLDEIKIQAIRRDDSAIHNAIKDITNSLSRETEYGVFLGAFNIEGGILPLQLLRRIFFVSFKKPLLNSLKSKINNKMKQVDWDLYLYFLSILNLNKIDVDKAVKEDILYPVRMFFKQLEEDYNVKLPISDKYLGSFERIALEEWKLFYLSNKKDFEEFEYNGEKCFKVPKEKNLVLLPYFSLDNGMSGNYYLINKDKFLKVINQMGSENNNGKFSFLKKLFKI